MESRVTGESDLLRDARQARAATQAFLHDPAARLGDEVRQAARDNLAMLQRIIDEETARE